MSAILYGVFLHSVLNTNHDGITVASESENVQYALVCVLQDQLLS